MLAPNTLLQNRYLVEAMLGQGGMGAVYKAVDQRFGSTVALKQMLVDGEVLRRAFQREAQLLNGLRHGALPVVIDYFTEEEDAFLVMQYIPGEDLAGLLEKRGGPFAVEEVLMWGDQLLDALDYLHNHQPPVIHRDIKPQNLKLTERGQIILLDFGLAKGSALLSDDSGSVSVLGYTPSYAPFEQVQGAGTGPRSDLYSLAATLYHLLTGVTPVDALTRTAAMVDSQPDPLQPANALNREVSASVAAVLEQAMALTREQRPASAAEMRKALREASYRPLYNAQETRAMRADEATVLGVAASGRTPAPQTAPQTARSNVTQSAITAASAPAKTSTSTAPAPPAASKRWLMIGSLIALLVIAAVAIVVWRNTRDKTVAVVPAPPAATPAAAPAVPSPGELAAKAFAFDMVTVDAKGGITGHSRGEAKYFTENLGAGVTLDMNLIPGGTFLMGSPETEKARFGEEGPQHNVELPPFYMGKFEVTQAQWRAVAGLPKIKLDLNSSPSNFEGVDRPVQNVSWEEAREFCDRLSKKTGKSYRLPSETEWEYACRAGTQTPFYYGQTLTAELANYDGREPYEGGPRGEFRKQTAPVGKTGYANAFGLYDMHGNLWEWTADPWHDGYNGAPPDGSVWESGGNTSLRVVRGGGWNRPANHCRSAYRLKIAPEKRYDVIGFRIVLPAK
jgi:formylglycine-generating enzyme required for sulfatase activity